MSSDAEPADREEIVTHLWEAPHPYYASEGNYYVGGYDNECHLTFDSWATFKEDGSFDADRDMNLVYRWDWDKPDPDDYPADADMPDHDTLKLFFVGQRKAIHRSEFIDVTEADEAEVRDWLTECAKTITAIWAPLELTP